MESSHSSRDSAKWRFTSSRERRLWALVGVSIATIYATLGLAGSLARALGDSGLNALSFVVGLLLVAMAIVLFGIGRGGVKEAFAAVGVVAIYVLVFTRLTSPVERSHLIEYGVVALLVHAALLERNRHGGSVPGPAVVAVVGTSLVGLVDELIQWFIPNRVFDPIDIVFNTVAATLAIGGAEVLSRASRKRGATES